MTPARPRVPSTAIALASLLAVMAGGSCGKKGPPLPPLHVVPAAPAALALGRRGAEARLQFTLPTANTSGEGRIDLDRVDVYAVTVAPGDATPSNAMLMTKKYLVGTIPVKPPPVEGEPAVEAPAKTPPDARPGPGDAATFVEQLTPDKLMPAVLPKLPVKPASPAGSTTKETSAAAAAQPVYPQRIYVLRAVSRARRGGPPSSRASLSLAPLPAAPFAVTAHFTESVMTVEWMPPVADAAGPKLAFNVYARGAAAPLNNAPLTELKFERPGPQFGTEQCFSVRSVVSAGGVSIESDPSADQCVTPRDTFPPAAPKGVAAVAVAGEIDLIWDANAEADLAGYLILRGEAPGDKLQPLVAAPTSDTKFADKTVKPGVRYVYAIVAVDKASNSSPQSPHIEETAR